MAATISSKSAWLQQTLSELLSSPYIHFSHRPGIMMGHGPIDLFSTRFNNTFPSDVQATVAGESVSREELKESLLGLQKHYKADNTQFSPSDDAVPDDQVKVAITSQESNVGPYQIGVTATVNDNKISTINLDGPVEVFSKA
ncbi:hypothetical protein Clacol_009154 [Clathrus columnatus]|uniref:Uncharacterized protein n=1 Tax=Clathrus columnatus TaxID=1419009 RepID=A0AAV5APZ1_9AGAM|nr:hypothetical protein Clacol_009154 [Clathrus columnatus]